jgi:hypothetical protein
MNYLTKSRLAEFEQCEKRFWLALNHPELADPIDPSVFEVGNVVGAIARANLSGVLIEERDPLAAEARTQECLSAGEPISIFEGAFLHDGVFVRVDVLSPFNGGWLLAEVKSSSSVKDYQVSDLATQVWAAQGAGLTLTGSVIRLIDTTFVYGGQGDYGGLLKDVPVAARLAPIVAGREQLVRAAEAAAVGGEPEKAVGAHCAEPFECPFTSHCGKGVPPTPEYPVDLLPGQAGKATAAKLRAAGVVDIRDAPAATFTAANERRMYEASRSGEAYHDRAALSAAAADWAFPRYFLDFETVGPAIPLWANTRPYQAIPFQFSCHIQTVDGGLEHDGFLDVSGTDPRRDCAEKLLQVLGHTGAVVTYNLPTERAAISGLADLFPDLSAPLMACVARLVDALPLVRAHYYHPQMKGSYSLKAVLPAVAPHLSYEDLEEVQDGQAAGRAYVEAVAAGTTPERRDELHSKLWAYCELDTLAMVELVRVLTG